MASEPLALRLWQALTPDEQAQVLALQIDADQVEYAGTVQRAVDSCAAASADEAAGLAILVGARVAGFLVLRRGPMLPDWAPRGSAALAGMRVDRAFQGAGVGRRALQAVDDWLASHWPDVAVVALTVDEENAAARAAYRRAGYVEFAEPRPGRIGTVRHLAKQLRRERPAGGSHEHGLSCLPLRLEPGADLRRALEQEAQARLSRSAFVVAGIGSLSNAVLRLAAADQETRLDEPLEVLSLSGTLSAQGAHLHVAVATASGRVWGGHLCHGSLVRTTAEVLLAPTTGWQLGRVLDDATGYLELQVRRLDPGA